MSSDQIEAQSKDQKPLIQTGIKSGSDDCLKKKQIENYEWRATDDYTKLWLKIREEGNSFSEKELK